VNPSSDKTSKVKIEEALSGVVDVAKAANAETADPAVISDPSRFWGQDQLGGAAAASSYPAEAMPASPPVATMPAIPAAPAPTAPAFIP
jgi:hypothetical protein